VHIFPFWAHKDGIDDILCHCAEVRKYHLAFPKLQKWGWCPEDDDYHAK
jgi:hypothetical protein